MPNQYQCATFDRIIVVDWSAAARPSPERPSADAIWIAECGAEGLRTWYLRTRSHAMVLIAARIQAALDRRLRLLCGFDFPLGYPAGFATALTGAGSALAVWADLADRISDGDDNANNRFPVAAGLNARFPGFGPFWGCPAHVTLPGLPQRGSARADHGLPERRAVERAVPRAQSCWKLYTTGSVGSQALLGQARLHGLRAAFGANIGVWPFEPIGTPAVLAEIYPSLLAPLVARAERDAPLAIRDAIQVRLLASALYGMAQNGGMAAAMAVPDTPHLAEEGWILGAGAEAALTAAAETVFPEIEFLCSTRACGQSNVPVTRPSNMNARAVRVSDKAATSASVAVVSNPENVVSNRRRK